MISNFELVVFDWDGTIMDSAGTIAACIQAACRDCDLPIPTESAARHVIGLDLTQALSTAAPSATGEKLTELINHYRRHYLTQDHLLTLFAGTRELLVSLKEQGRLLAVATGKSRAGLNRALKTSGLEPLFDTSRCADETFSKPHPRMLLEICEELSVPPNKTLMIGDTTHDLLLAQNAGAHGVGVSFGAHPHEQLMAAPNLGIFESTHTLSEWLLKI